MVRLPQAVPVPTVDPDDFNPDGADIISAIASGLLNFTLATEEP
jgi:hypothetical protein